MDGPVEIELEGDDDRGRRGGRRRRGRRDHGAGREDSGGDPVAWSDGGADPAAEPQHPLWEHPSVRRWGAIAAAVVLLSVGFVLGRAGGTTDDTDASTADPAAAAGDDDDAVADDDDDAVGHDGVGDEADGDDPTIAADDPTLETLPSIPDDVDGAADDSTGDDAPTDDAADNAAGDGSGDSEGSADPPDDEVPTVRIDELGGPLLPVSTGLVVVGITSDNEMIEIDLDRGTVRTTQLEGFRVLGNQPYVAAMRDVTVVGTYSGGPSDAVYLVPLGGEPVPAPGPLRFDSGVLPLGSEPNEIWTVSADDDFPLPLVYQRVDGLTLGPVGEGIRIDRAGQIYSDPRGGMLMFHVAGGTYRIDDAGIERISTGRVLAAGTGHFVVSECDDTLVCSTIRIDRETGERTPVELGDTGAAVAYFGVQRLAPDGSISVSFQPWRSSDAAYTLIDLTTGEQRNLDVLGGITGFTGPDPLAGFEWTDDSRFLLYLSAGRLSVYDRAIDTSSEVGGNLFGTPDAGAVADVSVFALRAAAEPITPSTGGPASR